MGTAWTVTSLHDLQVRRSCCIASEWVHLVALLSPQWDSEGAAT